LEAELARLETLPDSEDVIRQRYAVQGALELARLVAADAGSMEDFREWLRAASEEWTGTLVGEYDRDAVRAYVLAVLSM